MESYLVKRRMQYFTTLVAVLCIVVMPAAATSDFMAAGVLLVAAHGQSAKVLLVKHHSRAWYEMPGGRRQIKSGAESGQGGQHETAYQTAIRECFEETRGVLSPEVLRQVVDPSSNIRDGGFVFFLAKIEWFSVTDLTDAPGADDDNSAAFGEIADYAWLSVDTVLATDDNLVSDVTGRTIRLRPELRPRLERARRAGWF